MSTTLATFDRAELDRPQRSVAIGYALLFVCFPFGICGLHRLYAGRYFTGVLWLVTGGLCGVGQLVDLFFLPRLIDDHNAGRPVW